MNRMVKISLAVLGGLVVLLVGAAAFIALTFDPNAYKSLLVETVQKQYGRALAIPGPISLTFLPRVGLKLGEVTLSERQSSERFASLRAAEASLAVWPLLRRQVVVDRLQVDGLRLHVVRGKDGKFNFDDLLGGGAARPATPAQSGTPAAAPLALDVAGIAITDAEVAFDDRQGPRRVNVSGLALQTGRFAAGVPTDVSLKGRVAADAPKLDADLALKGRLQMGPPAGRTAVEGLELDLDARLDGRPLKVRVGGSVELDTQANKQGGKLDAKLGGTLDGSRFDLRLAMPRLAPAAYDFDARFDRLDVDRFLGGSPAAAAPAPAAGAEKPLDLSALRDLDATGKLQVGTLQVMQLKVNQLSAQLKAGGGRVTLAPLAAQLYDGRLAGSAGLAAAAPARVNLQATLDGVALGPLLKDFIGSDTVHGRGSVALDVVTAGATVTAMKKQLGGSARLEVKDGSLKGINIAQAIRGAKAAVALARGKGDSGGLSRVAAKGEATDFSELTASFKIAGGVAHNDDLAAKSPLLRLAGNGDIDLAAGRLDYTVRATVVGSLEGQGSADPQAMRGQTVPVKLSGPLEAIQWRIDFAEMAKEAARGQLDQKREALKEDAKRRLGDKLRDLLKK